MTRARRGGAKCHCQAGRLVIWTCGATQDKYPFSNDATSKQFAAICAAAGPRACECGCTDAMCRALPAKGKKATKCPKEDAPTTVLSAGYYKDGKYKVNQP